MIGAALLLALAGAPLLGEMELKQVDRICGHSMDVYSEGEFTYQRYVDRMEAGMIRERIPREARETVRLFCRIYLLGARKNNEILEREARKLSERED